MKVEPNQLPYPTPPSITPPAGAGHAPSVAADHSDVGQNTIAVRQIREEDIPEFREVLDSVCRERRHLAMLEAPPIERVQSFVASNIVAGNPQFVAEENGRIVGWCDVTPGSAAVGMAHVGRLGMGVLTGYRGRKVGRRLINATVEKARMLGLEKIELGVFSSNEPAIALYRSLGFQEEGRKKRGRFVDGIYDDVILMALELKRPNPIPDPTPGSGPPPPRREAGYP
jgi:ribosomal protein S18 acetylase RimI-like enzyme